MSPRQVSLWRASVAGAFGGLRRWAVGHRTPEGPRSLSFLRPLLGCSRRAPVVAVHPPRPGSLAVLQLGWGTPWCTGPVGWADGARVWARCHRALHAGGGVGGVASSPLVQAFGRPRIPLAACPWLAVPPAVGRLPTLGVRWRMSRTLRLLLGGGPCEALPVTLARLAWESLGCAPRWVQGLLDRRRGSVVDDVHWAWRSLGLPWPLCVFSWKTTRRAAGGGVRLRRRVRPGFLVSWCRSGVPPCTPEV